MSEPRVEISETRSVWNEQSMECDYIQAKSSNWSKQGQYGMRRRCNGSTYPLRVQVGRNEVSME